MAGRGVGGSGGGTPVAAAAAAAARALEEWGDMRRGPDCVASRSRRRPDADRRARCDSGPGAEGAGRCVCERAKCCVFCGACGHMFKGRVQRDCPQHPRVSFLFDYKFCPHCRVPSYLHEVAH